MKIIWSGIGITDGRGKIGGQFASRNASGAFLATIALGTNPQTPEQVAARARYAQALSDWTTLGKSLQDSWIAAAATGDWDTYDSLGQLVQPTGQQLFVRVNCAVDPSLQPVSSVPLVPSIVALNLVVFEVSRTGGILDVFRLGFTETTIPAQRELVVWVTPPLSTGINRPSDSKFRQLTRISKTEYDAAGGSLNFPGDYVNRFGVPALGSRIFSLLEVRDTLSGRSLRFYRDFATVETT